MTNRKGRQKTIIVQPYLDALLKASIDLIEHAGDDSYAEARLIRASIRECAARIAEEHADSLLARLDTMPAAEARRIRSEVESRRKKLHDAAAKAKDKDD